MNTIDQHTTDTARKYLIESYNRAFKIGGVMLAHQIFEGIHQHYESLSGPSLYLKDKKKECKVSA